MSLRQPLFLHERTRRGAICPRWQKRTPAMAAGLTDHAWTLRELLTAKFESLDSQSISGWAPVLGTIAIFESHGVLLGNERRRTLVGSKLMSSGSAWRSRML